MARFDYDRFVYETLDTKLANAGGEYTPSLPGFDTSPIDANDINNLSPTKADSDTGSANMKPASPENTTGKVQDQAVFGMGNIIDPCWLMNKYDGPGIFKDSAGNDSIITGGTPLSRGDYAKVQSGYGYVTQAGAYDYSTQSYAIWLEKEDGTKDCLTIGALQQGCQPGSDGNWKKCTGDFLGGVGQNIPQLADMWTRFKACMLTKFPECEEV